MKKHTNQTSNETTTPARLLAARKEANSLGVWLQNSPSRKPAIPQVKPNVVKSIKPTTTTATGPSREQLNVGLQKGESIRKTFFSNGEYVRIYTSWKVVPAGLGHSIWWFQAHNRCLLKGQRPVAYKKTREGSYMGLFTIEQTYVNSNN